MNAFEAALARQPRVALAHLPTPLEPLDGLTRTLGPGPRIFAKRDDCTGLAFGGNKVRKLEYLIGEALAEGADTVITTGGVQSNHARQTAAAAAKLGLACELVLPRMVAGRDPAYDASGNRLLDEWLGARVQIVDRPAEVVPAVAEIQARAAARGGKAAFIPAGGSSPTGCFGYAQAALELASQLERERLELSAIVLAVSTGGTLAGLLVGLEALGLSIPVIGIGVYAAREQVGAAVAELAARTSERLESPAVPASRLGLLDDWLGPGYGLPSDAMREAVALAARSEGLLLDPVYTGKAMAGLIGLRRQGNLPAGNLLFWHTGGAPGLFAYPELVPGRDDAHSSRPGTER
ncbi:MAG: D-cysteine desulfhydrase family protein [Myxococcota bacterium]